MQLDCAFISKEIDEHNAKVFSCSSIDRSNGRNSSVSLNWSTGEYNYTREWVEEHWFKEATYLQRLIHEKKKACRGILQFWMMATVVWAGQVAITMEGLEIQKAVPSFPADLGISKLSTGKKKTMPTNQMLVPSLPCRLLIEYRTRVSSFPWIKGPSPFHHKSKINPPIFHAFILDRQLRVRLQGQINF